MFESLVEEVRSVVEAGASGEYQANRFRERADARRAEISKEHEKSWNAKKNPEMSRARAAAGMYGRGKPSERNLRREKGRRAMSRAKEIEPKERKRIASDAVRSNAVQASPDRATAFHREIARKTSPRDKLKAKEKGFNRVDLPSHQHRSLIPHRSVVAKSLIKKHIKSLRSESLFSEGGPSRKSKPDRQAAAAGEMAVRSAKKRFQTYPSPESEREKVASRMRDGEKRAKLYTRKILMKK